VTKAQQAGLRLEDVPRPSLAKLRRRHKPDAKVRQALGRSSDDGPSALAESAPAARGYLTPDPPAA
jgi:hypothetical protein